ncbi:DUF1848 domain-containing protein [Vibrio sp. DNF-1]|nr:DUF1848 domain-containing protein [Vibrio salinus]
MNRIREGFMLTRNPFNAHQVSRVSLTPVDVDLFVFWTRNPTMLMAHLSELDTLGFRYYFQFTITGYPKCLEKNVPAPYRAIKTFCDLSELIGAEKVIWRYDPVLLCNMVDVAEHKRLFSKIAAMLAGKTRKVVISFFDLYKKTERNLEQIDGLTYRDITQSPSELSELALYMSKVAKENGMVVESCAEDLELSEFGIKHGKCIDNEYIKNVFGLSLSGAKDPGQRKACGCIKSRDIGMYNTCFHGCAYCYATFNQRTVFTNKQKHNPRSAFLIGEDVNSEYTVLKRIHTVQNTLF